MRFSASFAFVAFLSVGDAVLGVTNTASEVQFGDGIACALLQSSEIACWGKASNPLMQNTLTFGGRIARTPTTTALARSFTLGNSFLCMIAVADGAVECVGTNDNYELGVVTAQTPTTWQRPIINGTVSQLISMRTVVCASLPGNTSTCWGSVNYQTNTQASTLPPAKLIGRIGQGRLFPGGQMMCYQSALPDLDSQGLPDSLRCHGLLGSNVCQPSSQYRLDLGAAAYPHVSMTSHVVKVVGSLASTLCSLFENGQVRCVGNNPYGGRGSYWSNPTLSDCFPPDLVFSEFISDLASDTYSTCVVTRTTKKVFCWGLNDVGQLGRGDTSDVAAPPSTEVPLGDCFARNVTMYEKSVCVTCSSGKVKCWGANNYGQLGYGHTSNIGTAIEQMGVNLLYVDLGSSATSGPTLPPTPPAAELTGGAPTAPPTAPTTAGAAALTGGLSPETMAGIGAGGGALFLIAAAGLAVTSWRKRGATPVAVAIAEHVPESTATDPEAPQPEDPNEALMADARALLAFYESFSPEERAMAKASPQSTLAACTMLTTYGKVQLEMTLRGKYGRVPKW